MVNVVGTLNVLTAARDQAIEVGRKGGLARAARLSAARRFEISVMGTTARWWRGSSEVEWID